MRQRDILSPIKRIQIEVDTLPIGLRSVIANTLAARNRPTDFLGTVPEIAPIIGGNDAVEHKFPWHVVVLYFLYTGDGFLCGGSIYNERTIITAGHCADDVNQE